MNTTIPLDIEWLARKMSNKISSKKLPSENPPAEPNKLDLPSQPAEGFLKRISRIFFDIDPTTVPFGSTPEGPHDLQVQSTSASGSVVNSQDSVISVGRTRSRNIHSLATALFGLNEILYKSFHQFESTLQSTSGIVISTRLTAPPDRSNEYGYEVTTIEGTVLGNLVPFSEATGCAAISQNCCVAENEPMSYFIKTTEGEIMLGITGLDEDSGTDDVVLISQGDLKNLVGSVNFGYLGASGEDSSLVTVMAGRERSHMVPLSVIDMDGELAFIFRNAENNPQDETELLTADGNAVVVARMSFKSEDDSSKKSVKKLMINSKPFRVEFEGSVTTLDKTLIVGVAVVVYNRWLQMKRVHGFCCSIL